MANEIKTIPTKAREQLEAINEKYGIEIIEEYIKLYKKRQRKLMIHHNTKEDVVYDIYKLVFKENYNITRAKEKISIKRNISINTINNHLNNFNKEAKKNNFYTLGYIIDKIYYYHRYDINYSEENEIEELAKENNLDDKILETYYWKYKTLPKREKAKFEINMNSIKIPQRIKNNILPEYFSKKEDTINTTKDNNLSSNSNDDNIPF